MLIHVRYDEIALKGGRRAWFEQQLRDVVAAQTGVPRERVSRLWGRLCVRLEGEEPGPVLAALRRTFGVAGSGVVIEVPREQPAILAAAVDLARRAAAEGAKSFKAEVKRADKGWKVRSYDLACQIGGAVLDALPAMKVQMDAPDLVIHVEVRAEGTFVHGAGQPGPGGMPVGSAGRAVCLLSGGIDSPVAAWFALKRGLMVDGVHFHAPPWTGEKSLEKVLSLARHLSTWSPRPMRVHVLSTAKIQEAIQRTAPEELRIVLLRRSMYRLAREVARHRRADALVTGEALGQVASQTPENLLCVELVVPDQLVLRPLIGLDKQEIIERARAIGTYETSILPFQDCCSLFAPRSPATAARPRECAEAEAGIPLAELEDQALAAGEVHQTVRGGPTSVVKRGIRKRGNPTAWEEKASPAPVADDADEADAGA